MDCLLNMGMEVDLDTCPNFTKKDLLCLVKSKELPLIISSILSSFENNNSDKSKSAKIYLLTFKILKIVAHSIQLSYQKGELYEAMSQQYHKYGVFIVLIRNLEEVLSHQ